MSAMLWSSTSRPSQPTDIRLIRKPEHRDHGPERFAEIQVGFDADVADGGRLDAETCGHARTGAAARPHDAARPLGRLHLRLADNLLRSGGVSRARTAS